MRREQTPEGVGFLKTFPEEIDRQLVFLFVLFYIVSFRTTFTFPQKGKVKSVLKSLVV